MVVLGAISYGFRYWVLNLPVITVHNGRFVAMCYPNCATRAVWPALMVDWLPADFDLFAFRNSPGRGQRLVR